MTGTQQSSAVTVRAAVSDEYEAVADLVDEGFLAGPYGHLPVTSERRALQRDSAGRAESGALLVAKAEGTGAGTGALLGSASLLRAGTPQSRLAVDTEAELRLLVVAPSARGLGVGKLLVLASIGEARLWGAMSVVLDTGTLNHSAQRLYERVGFVRVPEREHAGDPGALVTSLVYSFPLA